MRFLGGVPLVLISLLALGWCALTLHYTAPGPSWLRDGLAALAVLGPLVGFFVLRPFTRALGVAGTVFALVLVWYLSLRPPMEADWDRDYTQLPRAELDGDRLTFHNVRNFDYRSETDFTTRWETRQYDLAKLDGLDMFFSYWSGPAIAHTIMSWSFSDGQHLAISIETRRRVGQGYSAVGGFFRQYPIYYVVADERDVIRLRTNYRGENVWLYRLQRARGDVPRELLLDYIESINGLAERPEWYNAMTDNCTTSIRRHVQHLHGGSFPLDWRVFVNGYLPELMYERGGIDASVPFDVLRERSNIDARAKAADQDPEFSARIREPAATQ